MRRVTILLLIFISVVLAGGIFWFFVSSNRSVADNGLGAALPNQTATGANVNESGIQQTIYVNNQSAAASDSNPGTQAAPLKTISRAIKVAQTSVDRGTATKISIQPGTYRELVQIPQSGKEGNTPFVIEGAATGSVSRFSMGKTGVGPNSTDGTGGDSLFPEGRSFVYCPIPCWTETCCRRSETISSSTLKN